MLALRRAPRARSLSAVFCRRGTATQRRGRRLRQASGELTWGTRVLLTDCQGCREPLLDDTETCPRCGTPNRAFAGGFDPGPGTPMPRRLSEIAFAAIARWGTWGVPLLLLCWFFLREYGGRSFAYVAFMLGLAVFGGVTLWRRRARSKGSSKR